MFSHITNLIFVLIIYAFASERYVSDAYRKENQGAQTSHRTVILIVVDGLQLKML